MNQRIQLPANLRPLLFALLVGLIAAALCVQLNMPLPWMIGPLFSTGAARMVLLVALMGPLFRFAKRLRKPRATG